MHPETVDPSLWAIAPFVFLLLAIALSPFAFQSWWLKNYAKTAVALGLVTTLYYTFVLGAGHRIADSLSEYVSFICLIGSLFVICGGIHVVVIGQSKPLTNTLFLLMGAVLSNIFGTTGASMLLLRPWVKMNNYRYAGFHTAFFIFIVSNTSGCLTPVGDPPLFLGYLKGIPFFWTLTHLWLPWVMITGSLLILFFVFDVINYRRAPLPVREEKTKDEKFAVLGFHNLGWLVLVLVAIFQPSPLREAGMIVAALASWKTTKNAVHEANDFTFGPIKEVAWLFLGIFATMVPALDYLSVHARDLGINSATAFYFSAGALSSVLDNAPTYLSFLATSVAQFNNPTTGLPLDLQHSGDIVHYMAQGKLELIAISLGAVWFGAMTYIGNGPNFMVKAIVEASGRKTPHFLEYIYRYALPILFPVLVIVGWVVLNFVAK